jgi:hypothetical protein
MKSFKLTAIAAVVLSGFSLSASAMNTLADDSLSQVSGQDGVSIVADLNVNIGSVTYKDDGASLSLNDVNVKGLVPATIDVLTGGQTGTFMQAIGTSLAGYGASSLLTNGGGANVLALQYTGGDVVQIAFPKLDVTGAEGALLSVSVGSITTGNGGASLGGLAIDKINMGGTKVWIYGH